MDKLKELVLAYIAKTQGKTPQEVSSLLFKTEADNTEVLKDDALNALFDLDKARVQAQTQKFDTERKEAYDKGFNKSKAEALANFEKDLRDKHKITEELKGTALVDAILAKQAKESGTGEPTEDQVKRSKTYLDTIDQLKTEKLAVETEWKGKYEGREKEIQRESTFKTVADDALTLLDTLNPVLPGTPELDKEYKGIFLDRIKQFDYEIKDGKKIVLQKDAEGNLKALLDEHAHPVAFESLVKQKAASLFKFKEGEPKKGTGNNNDDPGSGTKGYTGPVPKSESEYMKLMSETKDEATQIAITKAYTGK